MGTLDFALGCVDGQAMQVRYVESLANVRSRPRARLGLSQTVIRSTEASGKSTLPLVDGGKKATRHFAPDWSQSGLMCGSSLR